MVTLESRDKGGTWGLRPRLLVPIFGLAVLIAIVLAVIGDLSARRQAEDLVRQRGNTVLEGSPSRSRRDSVPKRSMLNC